MCLIVVKSDNEGKFTEDNFRSSYNRNSDGMGIMYLEKGRVQVERVIGPLQQQLAVYNKHKNKELFVLHHRFATHGSKQKLMENCHPYKVMSMDDGDPLDIYMAHNGVIGDAETTDKSMSDTWNFIENHIKPMLKINPSLLWNDAFQMFVSKYIGNFNKLVFLSNTKKDPMLIFNKAAGTDLDGCWLSNTNGINTYKAPATVKRDHNTKYYGTYDNRDDDYCGYGSDYSYSKDYTYKDGVWTYEGEEYKEYGLFQAARLKSSITKRNTPPLITDNSNKKDAVVLTKVEKEEKPTAAQVIDEALREAKEKQAKKDEEKYKNDLHDEVLAGTMSFEDVKDDFTEEELAEIALSLDSIQDDQCEYISGIARESYDPENCDKEQLKNLVEKVSKEFNYVDLEVLVDAEPQITADMLEFLLEAYNSDKKEAKAA